MFYPSLSTLPFNLLPKYFQLYCPEAKENRVGFLFHLLISTLLNANYIAEGVCLFPPAHLGLYLTNCALFI